MLLLQVQEQIHIVLNMDHQIKRFYGLTKNKDGNVIGSYQTVVIRLQYTNYIYGEKITHDLPINYSVIPEVIVKTEIINNPL